MNADKNGKLGLVFTDPGGSRRSADYQSVAEWRTAIVLHILGLARFAGNAATVQKAQNLLHGVGRDYEYGLYETNLIPRSSESCLAERLNKGEGNFTSFWNTLVHIDST